MKKASHNERAKSARPGGAASPALALVLSVVVSGAVHAQNPGTDAAGVTQAERALEAKRQALQDAKAREEAIQTAVSGLDADREKLNAELLSTAANIQKIEGQLTSIEGRLSELEAQEKIVRGSLMQRHGQIAKLLAALQRMGRNPPPVLITRREDALKMVRSAMMISSAFPELKDQALSLASRLDELVRVMTDARQEGDRLKAETARLNEARSRLGGLMEVKKLTLADRQAELAAVRAASSEISRGVGDLAELIGKLDRTVAEKTGLGSYNDELKKTNAIVLTPPAEPDARTDTVQTPAQEQGAPARTAATDTSTSGAGLEAAALSDAVPPDKETQVAALSPPPRLKPQIIEIAPSNAALTGASPGRIKPAIPFSAAREKLPLPAQGRRVLAFGERTQYGANSKGVVIETRSGAQITAPCDGWIVYAGEFRSYGQLLIINAGDGYHVLLAGMSQIDVTPGQFVLAAEPVGTMSAMTNSQGAPTAGSPVLYIEFRKDGRPIDPDPWWVAGQQKVQG